ncbi:MAG: 2'-5' RNA ligase family protein [Nanoarchaeota archaeon]|nr:2'-5' RNA ligase family protein [Nanoarchaeota archaeon]MBU1854921.1 2'-5' RNA ligase family protein [Nanoarchaeota archaeon]
MSERIAIDIALLLPEEINNKVMQINKALIKEFPPNIVFNEKNCFPHISLFMGVIEKEKLPEIDKVLASIIEKFQVLKLDVKEIDEGETLPDGYKTPSFKITRNAELQLLHERIMDLIRPLSSYDATADDCYNPSEIKDLTFEWINKYPKYAYKKFNPHITLGSGITNYNDFPIKFSVSRLVVSQLGNYCTCRKILIEKELR